MATTDNELNDLIINDISQEEYDNLVATGQVQEGQIYATDGAGGGGDIDISHINNESVVTKDLTVSTDEGTINIGVVAGVATIATNNGLDIVSPTKFDTAPTTDDNTTYANALDTSLVRKAQVATAIADALANVDALPDQTGNTGKFLKTDGTNVNWGEALVNNSTSSYALAVGNNAQGGMFATSVGDGAGSAKEGAVSIGRAAKAWGYGVAIGMYAQTTAFGAIQIAAKKNYADKSTDVINADPYTFKVYNGLGNFEMMSADGTIPAERLSAVAGTTGQVLTKTDDGMAWQDGAKGGASLPILMAMWSDHVINDMSWLRADTFSWQSGDVYVAAYEHLVGDLDTVQKLYCWIGEKMGDEYYTYSETPSVGETTTDGDAITGFDSDGRPLVGGEHLNRYPDGDILSTQTDTIGDITISYYLAEDGHKICLPDQESKVTALYETTGVAWYFILDTENKQFKLPRISPDKENIATNAPVTLSASGSLKLRQNGAGTTDIKNYANDGINTFGAYNVSGSFSNSGPSGSGSAYMKYESGITGTTDLTNATSYFAGKKYLYFYVGNFEQTAVEQTAGLNAELFNGKLDLDVGNAPKATKETIVGWGIPDYTAGVTLTAGVQYTASTDGVIFASYINNKTRATITINGVSINLNYCFREAGDVESESLSTIPVAKGDVYTLAAIGRNAIFFFPLKG